MPLGPAVTTTTKQTPARTALSQRIPAFLTRTSFKVRLLSGVWILFLVLVAFGVHGSSIPFAAEWWAPQAHYSGYIFGFIPNLASDGPRINNIALRELAMTQPRSVRSDEWLVTTPLALAQLSHRPRFPVVNTNIGDGQNMLINPSVPVWHFSLAARPVTWGYFILGGQRGLAWSWWFQVFSCFTALFLLLEIILAGRPRLAAFGAFWFCASAYVVCFSLLPAYYTALAAAMCVGAYYILCSNKPALQLASGALLGAAVAGFLMLLYPPWQIPLAYLVLLVFIALVCRDRLYRNLWPISASRFLSITVAVVVAAALTAAFLATCLPALKVMAATVYPGHRVSEAGAYKLRVFFRGMYNLISAYSAPGELSNQSEASSFYYMFPPILLALAVSRRFRQRAGIVGLALSSYILLLGLFAFFHIPGGLARLLLLNYALPARTDIGFGLASILLSTILLATPHSPDSRAEPATRPSTLTKLSTVPNLIPAIPSVAFAVLILVTGIMLSLVADGFPPTSGVVLVALMSGLASFCLLAGRRKIFCYIIGAAVIATSAFFNPLSTNLDYLYQSELARKITELSHNPVPIQSSSAPLTAEQRPLWLCYGLAYPEVQVQILGARALPGIQWPPQLELWRRLDPSGAYEQAYNRYAHVQLGLNGASQHATFVSPKDDTMVVNVSPADPALVAMGARYVLAMYKYQEILDKAGLPVIYKSPTDSFTIYGIPGQSTN